MTKAKTKTTKATPTKKAEVKKIISPVVRIAFPHFFKKQEFGESSKYRGCAIYNPEEATAQDKQQWKALLAELNRVSLEAFGTPYKELPKKVGRPIWDGADKAELDGFEAGQRCFNMSTDRPPAVVDIDRNLLDEGDMYGGCYVRIALNVYSYDNKYGKGISIGLGNVQKIKDGEPFGATQGDPNEDFTDDVDESWVEEDDDLGGDDEEEDVPFD